MTINYQDVGTSWQSYRAASEAFEQGHLTKAARILREALQDSRIAGVCDPLLIHSANVLADRYLAEGDYSRAAALYRAMLEVRTHVLGDDHPDVRATRSKLANALWNTGGLTPKLLAANQLH